MGSSFRPIPLRYPFNGLHGIAGGRSIHCRCGVISVGDERPHDGSPVRITVDDEKRADLRSRLAHQLKSADQRLQAASAAAGLPKIVAVVNHDPICHYEDLTAALEGLPDSSPSTIDLLIWFDDYQNDRMLFRRSDPSVHQKLLNWFHD